jgi:hypothetical protein
VALQTVYWKRDEPDLDGFFVNDRVTLELLQPVPASYSSWWQAQKDI